MRYDEIYPYPIQGCLLGDEFPGEFAQEMAESCAASFSSLHCLAQHLHTKNDTVLAEVI
jgi:hypothetical protein